MLDSQEHTGEDDMPKYVGEQGENRLFQEKDMAGFYYVASLLREQDVDDNFLYVGLGRSPVVVMEFLRQLFGIEAFDLPLSIETTRDEYKKGLRDVPYGSKMADFIEQYLPRKVLKGRKLILVDYVDSGYSLMSAQALMEQHLLSIGLSKEAEHVYIAPLTELKQFLTHKKSVLGKFDPDISAAHRLLKVLKGAIDKESFARFERTSEAHINKGLLAIEDPKVERRLRDVMKLAITQLGGDKGEVLKLLGKSDYLKPRKNPGRSLDAVFRNLVPLGQQRSLSVLQKEHLNDLYSQKSAKEYGIPNGVVSYRFNQALTFAKKNPFETTVGAVFAIMAIFFIYMLFTSWMAQGSIRDDSSRLKKV